jgi:hypothetical protein
LIGGGGGSKFLNFFRLSAAARDFKIFFACRRRRRLENSKMENSFENKKIPVYFNI